MRVEAGGRTYRPGGARRARLRGADQRAALDRGAETCLDIADKKPENEQERNVASRFAVDATQAKKILAVTKSNLCLG
jgi:hypothetical protein